MSTFDGWETQLYGDVMALPTGDELMHFRTKGSKNGVRRYQTESGAWTPLGLKERKAREGWGQSRAERKAAKATKKLERREARKARVAAAKEAYNARKNKRSLKGLSDEELKAKINRLKLEKEYKDLNKNPMVETGAKLVKAYFDAKDAKLKRESEKANLIVRQQEALAKLTQAKANKIQAKGDILDNIIGGKSRMKAKNELLKTKSENTILGALRKGGAKIINKETSNIVKEMPDHSVVLKGGRKVKNLAKKAFTTEKELVKAAYAGAGDEYIKRKYKAGKKRVIDSLKG